MVELNIIHIDSNSPLYRFPNGEFLNITFAWIVTIGGTSCTGSIAGVFIWTGPAWGVKSWTGMLIRI